LQCEQLEDRTLLAGDFLFIGLVPGTYTPVLLEYTQAGVLVNSTPLPVPPDSGDDGSARSVAVDPMGNLQVYTGTFDARLSTYSPSSKTWSFKSFPGFNVFNSGNFGGVAAYSHYVFATDVDISGDTTDRIVRFDSSGGPTIRFANGNDYGHDYIAITMGLDGLLYALNQYSGVAVYDPNTLALLRTIDVSNVEYDAREIAVDAAGNLYFSQYESSVRKVDPTGTTILAEKQFGPAGTIPAWVMGLDNDGQIVVAGSGTFYVSDESLTNVTSFNVPNALIYATFNHYIPATAPPPVQENFVAHSDNQVFGQKFDANGIPSGKPYLVANGSLRSVVSARDAAGKPVLFGIDPYLNHIWELKFDANGDR
jgi:hypothetical protein